jgi:pimeloyl-ACP methyl ester carboxylesterase
MIPVPARFARWAVAPGWRVVRLVRSIDLNGVDLEFVDEGAGVPVVFSHGGGSDVRYWEAQRAVFAARFRFVAYSHRFHGRGRWPVEGDYSADAHTRDLLAILRRLDSGPAHLVGFSSAIALRATLAEPSLVRTLTIIEPNVPWLLAGDPEGEAVLASWRAANARVNEDAAGDSERRARRWFELVNNRGPDTFAAQPAAFRRMWLDNFGASRPAAPRPEPLTCEQLATIGTRTLALGAEHGMPYSRTILDRLAACIPGSRLQILPGVTHFMSYQAPEAFNEAVIAFQARH